MILKTVDGQYLRPSYDHIQNQQKTVKCDCPGLSQGRQSKSTTFLEA